MQLHDQDSIPCSSRKLSRAATFNPLLRSTQPPIQILRGGYFCGSKAAGALPSTSLLTLKSGYLHMNYFTSIVIIIVTILNENNIFVKS
jgi:hypothetical protein